MMIGIFALVFWIGDQKKSVTIYDFARTIQYDEKSNYALTSNDLVAVEILAADVKEDYIIDAQEVIGKYITGTAYKGQHVMKSQVQSEPTYTEIGGISELAEYRKFYIPVNLGSAFAGDIRSGQTVDLLWAENGTGLSTERTDPVTGSENGINYHQARIIMSNIPVYQVYCSDGSVYKKRTTDPETLNKFKDNNAATLQGGEAEEQVSGAPAYVALSVTVDQYEELYVRNQTGTLSLVSRFDESADVESDGYLVLKDGLANVYTGKGHLEYEHGIVDGEAEMPVIKVEKPSPYSYLTRMTLASEMTAEQDQQYKNLYAEFAQFAEMAKGADWQNDPNSVSANDLQVALMTQEESQIDRFLAWKENVELLAKELNYTAELPW